MNRRHSLLAFSERPAKQNARRLRDVDPDSRIELTIGLRGPEMPDPGDGPALTSAELAEKYGASAADADKVAKVLGGYGLTIDEVSLPGRTLRVSGTAAQIMAAFPSNLAIYHSVDQEEFRGREGSIHIPAELEGIITEVLGLDERRVAQRKSATATATVATTKPKLAPLTPPALESHYAFPPGDAAGQHVAIAEFGGGYFPDDLAAYCGKFGRAVPAVDVVEVGLHALTLDEIRQLPPDQRTSELGATGEVMMDVQVIAGLCPKAKLSLFFAPFTQKGWVDLINKVIATSPTPVALSVSWGLAEDDPDWSAAARAAINTRLKAAALLGITVCVASGDDGSGDQVSDGRAHVDFPSASPFVLAVGGTMITPSAGGTLEQVWWEAPGRRTSKGGGATGGGVSTLFHRPTWQDVHVSSLNLGSIDGRVIPDVAALAGAPLYDLILLGRDFPNGGTSASAPLWAALIARVAAKLPAGKQRRFLAPLLYQHDGSGQPRGKSVCKDITTGTNVSRPSPGRGYEAGVGFDAATGWGVPEGTKLLAALS